MQEAYLLQPVWWVMAVGVEGRVRVGVAGWWVGRWVAAGAVGRVGQRGAAAGEGVEGEGRRGGRGWCVAVGAGAAAGTGMKMGMMMKEPRAAGVAVGRVRGSRQWLGSGGNCRGAQSPLLTTRIDYGCLVCEMCSL